MVTKRSRRRGERENGCVSVEVYSFSNYVATPSKGTRVRDEKRNIYNKKLLSLFNNVQEDLRIGRCCLAFQQLMIIEDMPWSWYFVSRDRLLDDLDD